MNVIIDGTKVKSEHDVHSILHDALDFGPYYGWNLAALYDRLSTDIERPLQITWKDADVSRMALGSELFDKIIRTLKLVEESDRTMQLKDRFTLVVC